MSGKLMTAWHNQSLVKHSQLWFMSRDNSSYSNFSYVLEKFECALDILGEPKGRNGNCSHKRIK